MTDAVLWTAIMKQQIGKAGIKENVEIHARYLYLILTYVYI